MGRAPPISTLVGFLLARRARVPVLASTAYVVAAAFRASGGGLRPVGTGVLALVIAGMAVRRDAKLPIAAWGLAVVVASLGASHESALTARHGAGGSWLDAMGIVGATAAAIGACLALARMNGPGGLGESRRPSPAIAVGGISIASGLALAASVGAALGTNWTIAAHARALAFAAELGTAIALLAFALNAARSRRLELGVGTRARAAAALVGVVVAFACAAGLMSSVNAFAFVRVAAAAGAVLAGWVALHGDAVRIAQISRRVMVLAFAGGPILLLGVTMADGRPFDAAAITGITALCALLVGGTGAALALPLRPTQGAWLDAITRAHDAILRSEADDALPLVLSCLREPAGAAASSPELWTLVPARVMTIDAAGYAREREGEIPPELLAVASAEPEATLRIETLSALEVRRPDLRPIARWMDTHTALLAIVITRAGEAEGVLVVPRGMPGSQAGSLAEPLTLEEVKAFKGLADALAGLCHGRAALARSLERERIGVRRAETAEHVSARFEHEVALGSLRNSLATTRLARPATVGVYSAASRMSFEALERRVKASAPVFLVVPSGVDPVPYLAHAHLGGPRASAPLVLVDGTSSREHDVARWADPLASPLALAGGGVLLLLDGAALPSDVQILVARALAERRAPWERPEPLDVVLVVTGVSPPEELLAQARLDPALAARLGDALTAPITFPRLRDRPEDVRAILTDRLAREGLRVKGTPVGIEDAAFGRLVEYPFEGEDAELASIVQRLVAVCKGDVVRAADVDGLKLHAAADSGDGEAETPEQRGAHLGQPAMRLSKRF